VASINLPAASLSLISFLANTLLRYENGRFGNISGGFCLALNG
jgi:hypothetical protein